MDIIKGKVDLLCNKNNTVACAAMKELQEVSEKTSCVYEYMDVFINMIENNNSYVRTRGLTLIAANAKWDTKNIINDNIDKYLKHINDIKPITSRQCIKALPLIAKYKPELKSDIIAALNNEDISMYADSMQPLIAKDIIGALRRIE